MNVSKCRTLALICLALLCAMPLAAQPKPDQVIMLEGYCDQKDATGDGTRMHYLPFDVPEGVTRIEIKKQLDFGPKGSGTVDHGLADPRGAGFGMPGFRGWMGGSKADIFLTGDQATTSQYYVAGPIQPGRWTLLQWTVKLPEQGLNYRYTIKLSFDGPKPPDKLPEPPKHDQGVIDPNAGWYIGDLHTHTLHSDGNKTVSQLVQQREDAGFDFLCLTDHNANLGHWEAAAAAREHPKVLLLCGEEITCPGMHANVIGCRPGSFYDMRIGPDGGRLPEIIAKAHRDGGIWSLNHPFNWGAKDWNFPPSNWKAGDGVEVWNAGWDGSDRKTIDRWDELLQKGRHITAVCGSDTHGGGATGCVAIHVYAEDLSREAILNGLRKGHAFISRTSRGPGLYLSIHGRGALPGDTVDLRAGDTLPVDVLVTGGKGMTLRLVWPGGEYKLPLSNNMTTVSYNVPLDSSKAANYVRAELTNPDGSMMALTNPIYVRTRP